MRARSIRHGAGAALVTAVLALSACNMGGRPEPGTPQVAAVPPATAPTGPVVEAPLASPSPGTIEYYAMAGETVAGLAARFGVDAQSIIDANGLVPPYQLSPGQRLTIPPAREHVVVAGDTVYSIAKRYGVSREELVRLNGIPPSYTIRVGQRLVLPARPGALSAAPQAAVTATDATAAAAPPAAPSGPPIALQSAPAPSAPASRREIAAVELPPPAKPGAPATTSAPPAAPAAPQPGPAAEGSPLVVPQPRPALQPQPPQAAQPAQPAQAAQPAPAAPPAAAPQAPGTEAPAVQPAPEAPAAAQAAPAGEPAASAAEPAPSQTAAVEPAVPAPPPAANGAGVETLTAAAPEPPPLSSDKFLWPVATGRILMGFGPAAGGQQNDGINIGAAEGTPVRAAENGVVAYAGNELRGFGNLLLIRHADGWMSAYAHNETLLVKRGDTVRRGQIIARVGKTGSVSEPQLHFELRRGTRAVDPMPYLGEGGSGITPAASPGGRQDPG